MRIFIELMPKQPLSCEPNGYILVGFNGVPPLTQEAISEQSRIDRVQTDLISIIYDMESDNLKLGGNTDRKVRPKLILYQLRVFCFGKMSKRRMKHDCK